MLDQFPCRKVADVGAEFAAVQRRKCGIDVDDATTRKIDQNAAVLHQCQSIGIYDVTGGVQQRNVHAHGIGFHEQAVQRLDLPDTG